MSIGDLVQDKNYNKVGLRYIGLIIDGPYYQEKTKRVRLYSNHREAAGSRVQYWTVLWHNGKRQRIRLKEVKVISHAE